MLRNRDVRRHESNFNDRIKIRIVLFIAYFFALTIQSVDAQSALEFDSISDMAIIYDSTSLIPVNDFTIEGWFMQKPLVTGQIEGVLLSKYDSSWNNRCFLITASSGFIRCVLYCNNNDSVEVACNKLDTISWKHFALSYSVSNKLNLYLNGELVDSAQGTSPMNFSQSPIIIGNKTQSNLNNLWHYHGKVDEIRIWNSALDKSIIQQRMYVCLSGSESGLIALYSMDTGSGNILFDKTGNGFNGVIVNSSWVYSDRSCPFVKSNSPICQGNALLLEADTIIGASYYWTGPNSFTSNNQCPIIYNSTPSMSGWYHVTVDSSGVSFTDSTFALVNDMHVFIGHDTVICPGDNFILDAGSGYFYYEWNTGSHSQTIKVTQPGSYSVQVHKYTTNCYPCKAVDNINIYFSSPPLNLGNDSVLCDGDSVMLDAGGGYNSYLWHDGTTNQSLYNADSGWCWVQVSDTLGCIMTDSVYFDDEVSLTILFPSDTILCPGESLSLIAGSDKYDYLWSNGVTTNSLVADRQYRYHVTATNNNCASYDSVLIDYYSLGNETDHWYFGANSGIHFSGTSVNALTNGAMNQTEGCSSISDANGNLMFYTDGITVWNRLHMPMPNGTGLNGSSDATNSALIVKKPGSVNIYYVFTLDNAFGSDGLCYSVVDMNADLSFGNVVLKNITLLSTASEKMTAVKHKNNNDVWLIAHGMNSNNFYSYLITSSGINNFPVLSNTGAIYNNWQYSVGCMKVSPDGSKLAVAYHFQVNGFCELFDFDNQSGIVSNPITLADYKWPYGVEFSPDNSKLYISERMLSRIRQIDLSAGSPAAIINSATVVTKYISSPPFALQLGINGKIYVAKLTSPYLGVINSPDNKGNGCDYVDNGVFLAGSISKIGLPGFVQNYFNFPGFSYNNHCHGEITYFMIQDSVDIDSVFWDFGDPVSGADNYSSAFNPFHYYDTAGVYQVKLIAYSECRVDSVIKIVNIYPLPDVDLGNDTTILYGDTITLGAGSFQHSSYYWLPNGDTTQSINISFPGYYTLIVTDSVSGCQGMDTVKVNVQNDNCLHVVDFNTWEQKGDSANGDWNVSATGDFVYQTINDDLTFFVSQEEFINVEISGDVSVYSNWDDDYIGFVFGYQSPDDSTSNNDYDFVLFDWKQTTQTIASNPPAIAYEGFSLVKVDGLIYNSEIIDYFWSHNNDQRFQLLDTLYGSGYGWSDYQKYHFNMIYTSSGLIIIIDGDTIFNVHGCFKPGHFGLYNYSQAFVEYSDFSYQLKADFNYTEECLCEDNTFTSFDTACLSVPSQFIFWEWDFGDGNSSDKVNPSHKYTSDGIYPVKLKLTDNYGCSDSITKNVSVFPLPESQLPGDTIICSGAGIILDPGQGFSSYLWQDGSTNQFFYTDTAGNFIVEITDTNGCYIRDSVYVSIANPPKPDLGNDTTICFGDTLLLNPGNGYNDYLWHDGSTSQIYPAHNPGIFYVQVTDSNLCHGFDTITINTEYCDHIVVTLDTLASCPDTVIVPVKVNNIFQVGAISLILFYDSLVLDYLNFQSLYPSLLNGSYALNGSSGTFGMSWYSMNPVDIIDDTLVELIFYYKGGTTNLSWDTLVSGNCEFGDLTGNVMPSLFISGYIEQAAPNPFIIDQPVNIEVCENSDAYFIVNASADTSIQWQIYSGLSWLDIQDTASYAGSQNDTLMITGVSISMNNKQYRCIIKGLCNPDAISDTAILNVNSLPYINIGNDKKICHGDSAYFDAGPGFVSYLWNNGSTNQYIVSDSAGQYWVKVTDSNACSNYDTAVLELFPVPPANAGNDTSICFGSSITLTASGGINYKWNTGALNNYITVGPAVTTTFTVTVTDINGCTASDEVVVSIKPLPSVSLGNDTSICTGDSIILDAGTGFVSYLWQDGSTAKTKTASQSGLYWVKVENNEGCFNTAYKNIDIIPLPVVDLGNDTSICTGDSISFDAGTGFSSYVWNTGNTTQTYTTGTSGSYWVWVSDINGCSNSDTVGLQLYPLPNAFAGNDTSLCSGDSITLTASGGVSYHWNTGSTSNTIIVSPTSLTTYTVTATDINSCSAMDVTQVSVLQLPVISVGNDTSICIGDTLLLDAGPGFTSYLWQDGSTTQTLQAFQQGIYWAEATNSNGCYVRDSLDLTLLPLPVVKLGNDTSICTGDSITFDAGTGFSSYVWNTGNTTQTYTTGTSGNYWVIVSDINGCSNSDTVNLQLYPLPNAFAGNDTSLCSGDSITLTASGGVSYHWNTGSTSNTIIVSPTSLTTYTVTATDINSCSAMDDTQVSVFQLPVISVGNDTSICIGDTLLLDAGPGFTSYLWQDGSTTQTLQAFQQGIYWAEATNANGCYGRDSLELTLLPLPVVNLGNDTSICTGDSISFDAGTGFSSYVWNTGNTTQTYTTGTPGIYWVKVFDINGCSNSDTVGLQIYPLPNAFAGNDTSLCSGDSITLTASGGVSYHWNTGSTSNTIIVSPTSLTTYTVTATDINSCSAMDDTQVSVLQLPVISIGNDTSICIGDTIVLNAGSGYSSYYWNNGSTSTSITVSNQGMYWVIVNDINGCSNSDTLLITTYPAPVISVTPISPAICEGGMVNLSVSGAISYTWNPSGSLSSDTGSSVIAYPSTTTIYTVTGTNSIGCSSQLEIIVEVFEKPVITFSPQDPFICENDSIVLNAYGAYTYTWYPGIGLSSDTGSQVTASPSYPIRYVVAGTTEHNCSDTASIFVDVRPLPLVDLGDDFYLCDGIIRTLRVSPDLPSNIYQWQDGREVEFYIVYEPGIYWVKVLNDGCESIDTVNVLECSDLWIPSAFTPDGDGLNDIFKPKANTELFSYNIQIYNRWGELLFESDEIEKGWDGSFKGKICPIGVYTYKISYKGFGIKFINEGIIKIGYLTLIR